jgi:dCMP deaminase
MNKDKEAWDFFLAAITNAASKLPGRPDWSTYFLLEAFIASTRGACTRAKVGCAIVDPKTGDIIQKGYNGATAGAKDCLQGACPRGLHYRVALMSGAPDMCACGHIWPCREFVEHYSSYDTGAGSCIAIHAEANALIRAGKLARGMWMYCTIKPCEGCWKLIRGAGIAKVVWPDGSEDL